MNKAALKEIGGVVCRTKQSSNKRNSLRIRSERLRKSYLYKDVGIEVGVIFVCMRACYYVGRETAQ